MSQSREANVRRWIEENCRSKTPVERIEFMRALVSDGRLSRTSAPAVAQYLLYCRHNKTGAIFPGYTTIALNSGTLSVRTVQGAVKALERTGWFHVERRKDQRGQNFTNLYYPIWEQVKHFPRRRACEFDGAIPAPAAGGDPAIALGDPVNAPPLSARVRNSGSGGNVYLRRRSAADFRRERHTC